MSELELNTSEGGLIFYGTPFHQQEGEGFLRLVGDLSFGSAGYLALLALKPLPDLLEGCWTLGGKKLPYPHVYLIRYSLDSIDFFLHEVPTLRRADLIFSSTQNNHPDLLKRFPCLTPLAPRASTPQPGL